MTAARKWKTREERRESNPPVAPDDRQPDYVHACHERRWELVLCKRDASEKPFLVDYDCNSRRHEGPCRDHWAACLYARLMDRRSQFAAADPKVAMFWTLTLPPEWHGGELRVLGEANEILGQLFRSLKNKINKRLVRLGLPKIRYFWVREAHKDGTPHLHLVVLHEYLADQLRERDGELEGVGVPENDRTLAPARWRMLARESGFGDRFDAQIVESKEALAGYATKVCSLTEVDADTVIAGELTKGSQVPDDMPMHTRCYGYSRRFIPPRDKAAVTGFLRDKETGRRIVATPKLSRVQQRYDAAPGGRPRQRGIVIDADTLMGVWKSTDEAMAWVVADSFRGEPSRHYVLRPPTMFVANPKANEHHEPERVAQERGPTLPAWGMRSRASPWWRRGPV